MRQRTQGSRRQRRHKDRIRGSSTQAKGVVKELAGKALGDAKLTAEGRGDRAKGKLQSAIGGLKDALKKK